MVSFILRACTTCKRGTIIFPCRTSTKLGHRCRSIMCCCSICTTKHAHEHDFQRIRFVQRPTCEHFSTVKNMFLNHHASATTSTGFCTLLRLHSIVFFSYKCIQYIVDGGGVFLFAFFCFCLALAEAAACGRPRSITVPLGLGMMRAPHFFLLFCFIPLFRFGRPAERLWVAL